MFEHQGTIRDVARQALECGRFKSAEAGRFLEFITKGSRGIARASRPARQRFACVAAGKSGDSSLARVSGICAAAPPVLRAESEVKRLDYVQVDAKHKPSNNAHEKRYDHLTVRIPVPQMLRKDGA